jgi:hypothetical protein
MELRAGYERCRPGLVNIVALKDELEQLADSVVRFESILTIETLSYQSPEPGNASYISEWPERVNQGEVQWPTRRNVLTHLVLV